jgi:hypothetical protein
VYVTLSSRKSRLSHSAAHLWGGYGICVDRVLVTITRRTQMPEADVVIGN